MPFVNFFWSNFEYKAKGWSVVALAEKNEVNFKGEPVTGCARGLGRDMWCGAGPWALGVRA